MVVPTVAAQNTAVPLDAARVPAFPPIDINTLLPVNQTKTLSLADVGVLLIQENGLSARPQLAGSAFVCDFLNGDQYQVTRVPWSIPPNGVEVYLTTAQTRALQIKEDRTSDHAEFAGSYFASRMDTDGFHITRYQFDFNFPEMPFNSPTVIPAPVMSHLQIREDGFSQHPKLLGSHFDVQSPAGHKEPYVVTRRAS